MTTLITHETFNQAFLAATPEIASEILDMSFKTPLWLADIYELEKWDSNQNVLQQLVFKGSLPEVERGFDRWKKLANTAGCSPCTDDCSYNWTQFSGHGFERRMIELMRREFRTQDYCVSEIASTHEYEQVFSKVVENIYSQVAFFKEYNIGLNFLTGIAKKLMVDSAGLKGNSQDPYSYRPLGTVTLSRLNLRMLSKIYEGLRRRSDVLPFDVVNGQPLYCISASDELMDDLYLADANSRVDLRFSSAADALLTRYNFMSSIRNQFINAPLLYPRRFEYNALTSQWLEIVPFLNGLPAEAGSFSDLNPAYENATYEEVLIYGKSPFKVFYRPPVPSLGEGAEFGPEPTFMDTWMWVNVQTDLDPFKRVGYYATSAQLALSAQWSGGVYGIMVPRPRGSMIAEFFPADVCPPEAVVCDNTLPDVGCPCPLIVSAIPNPVVANRYFITFAVPVVGEVEDTIQLGIDTGGYISGEITAITADGLNVEVEFAAGTDLGNCNRFTTVFCDNTLGCSSLVLQVNDCRSGITGQIEVLLANPIKAVTAGNDVTAFMGDGTQQTMDVVSVDQLNNRWILAYAAGFGPTDNPSGTGNPVTLEGDLNCDRNGIVKICVPPTTNATCPACVGPVVTQCSEA